MLVREYMTTPAVTVVPGTTVRQALATLDRHGITAMPVVDEAGRLLGVVSEADLLRELVPPDNRTHLIPVDGVPDAPTYVDEVMNPHPVSVEPDSDLAVAVDVMTSTAIKSMPVVEDGRVVGVISRRDVVHAMARSDEELNAEVGELIREVGHDWLTEVENGVVQIDGPRTEPEARVAEAVASSVTGITSVRIRAGKGRGRRPR